MASPKDIHYEHPVIVEARRNNYLKSDLCRILNISPPTLNRYLQRPELVRVSDILTLAGLFNISMYEMMYKFIHSSNKLKPAEKAHIKEIELKFNISKD